MLKQEREHAANQQGVETQPHGRVLAPNIKVYSVDE
jgi:hypothetical protein